MIKTKNEKTYTVWVGGTEVNDYYLTMEQAKNLAYEWEIDGYDDVVIENIATRQGKNKMTKKELRQMSWALMIAFVGASTVGALALALGDYQTAVYGLFISLSAIAGNYQLKRHES